MTCPHCQDDPPKGHTCPVCGRGAALPYADADAHGGKTSGWSGSETSHARALADDESGRTTKRQRAVLTYVLFKGTHGATVAETRNALNLHHGQASGALSNLHKVARLARLAETRNRCRVYVAPEFVVGRETEGHGRTRGNNA